MNILISLFIFVGATVYVFVINSFALAPVALLRAMVIPMIIALLLVYRSSLSSWKKFLERKGKWFLLFWVTVLLQLLVLSTGGIQSPFLILIHLVMIGLSFLFSFATSVLFLIFSLIVIVGDIYLKPDAIAFVTNHPNVIILHFASLVPIVAVAYIISQQYHLKNMLSNLLGMKVKTDQAILERLSELIIITDGELNILSVNDAVERALRKSRSELINQPLFTALLIKNKEGIILEKEYFMPDGKVFDITRGYAEDCTLFNGVEQQKKLLLQAQPVENTEGVVTQISFILSYAHQPATDAQKLDISVERARAKYEAMMENMKNKLLSNAKIDRNDVILIENIEKDVYAVQVLQNKSAEMGASRIDAFQLSKQAVLLEQDFAQIFGVGVIFEKQNFGEAEIAPLTVKNYAVTPDQLTGPFFTVEYNVMKLGLLIKKMLDVLVLLSSTDGKAQVHLSIELTDKDEVMIKIYGTCPSLTQESLQELYTPYYGNLAIKTNLQAGSGLEGYLIKSLSESLGTPVDMRYEKQTDSVLSFTVKLAKVASLAAGTPNNK